MKSASLTVVRANRPDGGAFWYDTDMKLHVVAGRLASVSLRAAFFAGLLLTLHDLAGIQDADAPFPVGGDTVFRLFAASRAGMLAIAGFFITHQPAKRDEQILTRLLTAGLLGLCLNNDWFTYAPTDVFFWPAVVLNYGGVAVSVGTFAFVLLKEASFRRGWVTGGVIGIGLFGAGMLYPVYTFGPSYDPGAARLGSQLYWLVWIIGAGLLVLAAASLHRSDRERGYRVTLIGFIVLGAGTVTHGIARIALGGVEPRWAAGADALAQIAFAILLATAVFRDKHVLAAAAATRGVRYTAFGSALAVGFPALETYVDDLVAKSPLHALEAAGGEGSAHMLLSVATSLAFQQLDRAAERFIGKYRPDEKEGSGAPPEGEDDRS